MLTKLYTWAQARKPAREEEGQSLAEYGLILALIAVVAIAALTTLGGNIASTLNSVAGAL
ncbi:MAG: Flp family type IVb pilin [Chloroflexota bacterium]|nr:Flp family type IVb pilin [Dehalococcoidia bacterium]MDW8046026.1 Flp family type IVb pilin [Chloroflexota bacterium]